MLLYEPNAVLGIRSGHIFSISEGYGPFGNCIPVEVDQVIKDIEIFQWPSHLLIQEYILLHEVYLLK